MEATRKRGKTTFFKKISSIFLLVSLLMIITLPTSKAKTWTILPGSYVSSHNTKNCAYFTINWTVTSGSPIDVFFLTNSQYSVWNRSLLPVAAVYMELGSYGGFLNMSLNASGIYYAVFSNINGSANSSVEIESFLYNCWKILNYPFLIIGTLILAGEISVVAIYYVKKRSSKSEKKPPFSSRKLYLLFVLASFILNVILGFIFNETYIETSLITWNILVPIYAFLYFKYFFNK